VSRIKCFLVNEFWSKVLQVLERRNSTHRAFYSSLVDFPAFAILLPAMRKLLCLIILLALPNAAFAFGPGQPYAGLGFFFQNMFKVTDSPTAAKSPFGEVYIPELVLGYKLPLVFPSLA